MTEARDLVGRIRDELSTVEQAIRTHPYPQAFRNGTATVAALVPFVGHQYQLAHADIRSIALLVNHFEDTPAGPYFHNLLESEFAGLAGILRMAEVLDLSEADLRAYEPTAEGFAYAAYLNFLANQGSAAEVICGSFVNIAAWGFNCGEISQGLRDHYGWAKESTAFLDVFGDLPPFDEEALPIIQAGLDRGDEPRAIMRAARLIQSYERMFWDAMASETGLGGSA